MEIIYKEDSRYTEYENLLLERDRYRKEASNMMDKYIRIFGDQITAVFKQKIACIERKKMLSYCMMYYNRGESVDTAKVQAQIKTEMSEYQKQLDQMIEESEACKNAKTIPESDALRVKQIYRSIAKKLHPDLNPLTEQHEELAELWQRTASAYRCNDLKEIEETEVLVEKALSALGEGKNEISIPDIDEKTEKLREEIEHIKTTDPYLFYRIFANENLIAEKKKALEYELKEYTDYRTQLEDELKKFIVEGGTFAWTI